MAKLVFAALALALGVSGSVRAADKDDPTGTWKWTGKLAKKDTEQTLKIEVKDGKVTGTLAADKLDLKVEEGTFKDGELSFTATGERKGEKVVVKYTGKVTGDAVKGTVTVAELKGKTKAKTDTWEAKRDKPEKKKD